MRDGDLREQILGLEAQIEELAETIESCRKIIQISKAFIVVGGLLIAAITIGLIRFDPMLMIGALTAVVGGTVVLGSNWSTLQQASLDPESRRGTTRRTDQQDRSSRRGKPRRRTLYGSTDSRTAGYSRCIAPNADIGSAPPSQRANSRLPLRTASTTSRIELITS